MKTCDLSLELSEQSWAVLHYLSAMELEIPEGLIVPSPSTYAWYNGRERGFSLSFSPTRDKCLVVVVFEHRNSDNICAISCILDNSSQYDVPTMETHGSFLYPTDNKWDDIKKTVPFGNAGEMALWIRDELQEFFDSQYTSTEETPNE